MVLAALEAVADVGNLNVDLPLVENVVRKTVEFAVFCPRFQLDSRNALVKQTTVNQEIAAVNQFHAFARVKVVERAMPHRDMAACGGIQGGQGTHHFNE